MDTSGKPKTSPYLDAVIKDLYGWDYEVTSEIDLEYNCIAYAAAEDERRNWWPIGDPYTYWPEGAPAEETLEAFVEAYGLLGYARCEDDSYDSAYEKIALYLSEAGTPRHAAKQIDELYWKSKLGGLHDIRHPLRALEEHYGKAMVFLRRKKSTTTDESLAACGEGA
jgi:hypothetical protein